MNTRHIRFALIAGVSLLLTSVRAADFTSTWNGGNANWSLGANWTTPGAPGTFPNNGAFTYDAVLNAGTSTLTGDITVKQLALNGTVDVNGPRTLTLDGLTGTGTVDNTGFTGGAPVTLQVGNNNVSSSFAGVIKNTVGSLSVTKLGTGTLTLSGANTFSGQVNIQGGTVKIGADNSLPSATQVLFYQGSGTMKLDLDGYDNTIRQLWLGGAAGSTATVETGAGTLTLSGSGNNILYASGSGNGATINGNLKLGATPYESVTFNILNDAGAVHDVTINATISSSQGSRFFKDGAGTLLLTASNNTFGYDSTAALGGDAIIREGTLKLGADNVLPDGAGYGKLSFGTPAVAGAKLDMAGFSDTINGLNSTSPATGIVDNSTGNSTLTIGANNTSSSYRGTITNSGGTLNITKIGTSSLSYSQPGATHTYTGVTTISGGTLQLVTLANGGTASHIGASSSAAANLVLDGGALVYTNLGFGGSGAQSLDRLFTVTGNGGTITGSGLGALNFTNTGAYVASGTGDRTLTLQGSNTGANTLAGIIANPTTGNTGVTKLQSGTWALSGASTYGGTTTVGAGTLTATGSSPLGATTGALAVNNTNTGAGTAVTLNLSTTAPTTKGSLSGTKSTPSSGTNTATINNGGQLFTINQTADATYAGTIAGAGGFQLGSLSTNTLTMSGVKSYTGPTTVQAGTLAFTGGDGGSTTGDFSVSSAGTLLFGGANFTLGATSDVSGAGKVAFSAGTVTLAGTFSGPDITVAGGTASFSIPASAGAVTLSSGTLMGTTISASGPFNWTGGNLTGAGTFNANGGMTLGNASFQLNGWTLNLAAGQTAAMSTPNTALTLVNGTTINNAGTFLAQNNQSIAGGTGPANVFNNTGVFTRNTGAGTFSITNAAFNNTGTINADTGTLALSNLQMSGGTLNGAGTVNVTTLAWSSGTLSGTGALNVSGTATISGGSAFPKGLDRELTNNGTTDFVTGDFGSITFGSVAGLPGVINNNGTFNQVNGSGFNTAVDGGGLRIPNDNAINNNATGIWNVTGAGSATVNAGIEFNNAGEVNVTNSANFLMIGGGTHTGSFEVASGAQMALGGGTHEFNAGSSVTGAGNVGVVGGNGVNFNAGSTYNITGTTFVTGGTAHFKTDATTGTLTNGFNGTVKVSGASTTLTVTGTYTQSAGFTVLEGGAIIEAVAVNIDGGTLKGTGVINGPLTSNGTLSPGASPGTITVNGSTVLGGANTLTMEVGGLASGIDYDLLAVNGVLTLGGLLDINFINSFENSVQFTDIFTIATATSPILGSFSNVASGDWLNTNFPTQLRVYYGAGSPYGADNLVLTQAPEPSRALLLLIGMSGLVMRRRRNKAASGAFGRTAA